MDRARFGKDRQGKQLTVQDLERLGIRPSTNELNYWERALLFIGLDAWVHDQEMQRGVDDEARIINIRRRS